MQTQADTVHVSLKFIFETWSLETSFAEFERALIRERQREGIALAKKRGAYRGCKKALAPKQVADLRQRAAAGDQKATFAREFGISRETLYQYLRTVDWKVPTPKISSTSFYMRFLFRIIYFSIMFLVIRQ